MKHEAKNIVIVTSEFPPLPGGIGNHAYHLALYFSKNGYHVKVLADQRSEHYKQELHFDTSMTFEVERIKLRNMRILMYFSRIGKTLKSLKNSDVVIATGKFSLWNVAFCSWFYSGQKIAVVHGSEVNFKVTWSKKLVDWSLKRFDSIVAVSSYTKDLIGHIEGNIVVIPNGIDTKNWVVKVEQPIQLKGHPILTTVGRVSSRKGQLQVIKHLPSLIEKFPDIHYHCIGIPTEAEDFMKVAKDLEVSSHVTFHGALDDAVLKRCLKATDVFVMLSSESKTGDVEGFGIAILEANALGIPAIGSKGCGIEDAIDAKVSGILIDAQDSFAFKTSIIEILENRNHYIEGAKNWSQRHDWSIIIKRYIDLLK